jgi:flagellar protein FliO/FliZ
LSFFAFFVLAAGLLIQIPYISAQEVLSEDEAVPEEQAQARDPYAWERSITFGEDEGENASPSAAAAGPSIWTFIRMVLVLALVAAAVYGIVFFIRRSSRKKDTEDPFLKVLANTHLGFNRYAHIVSVGDKAWLLGSSDGGVNLIGEIDDRDVINAMLLEDSAKSERNQGRFPDFLGMIRRFGVHAERNAPSADDIRRRRERLKGL